jgi:hypothetical protein
MSPLRFGACAILLVLAGCLEPSATTCDDGRVCPPGAVCDPLHHLCVEPQQLASCGLGDLDGASCVLDAAGDLGTCHQHVCLAPGCGNGVLDPGEDCDGEVPPDKTDCTNVGYYHPGPITCNADCTFETSGCSGPRCGDGTVDREWHEECDGVSYLVDNCNQIGFYESHTLDCDVRTCRLDRSSCVGFCGDGIINGPEQCEQFEGWRSAEACFDRGYDFGALSCTQACVGSESACGRIGWQREGFGPASIRAMVTIGPEALMTLGAGGIWWWDGASWTMISVGPGLSAIASSTSEIAAVDGNGQLFRFEPAQKAWNVTSGPVVTGLRALAVDGYEGHWAIDATTLRKWGLSGGWKIEASYPDASLRVLWVSSTGDPWIGSDDGVVYHGGVQRSFGTAAIRAIWGTGADVYVAQDGVMRHWDGAQWTAMPLPIDTVANLGGRSSREVWVSGRDGALARWDGRVWLRIDAPPGASGALAVDAHGRVWTGGGTVWRWQGRGWSSGSVLASTPAGATGVLGIAGTDEANLWVDFAFADGAKIYHFDGAAFTLVGPGRFVDGWGTGPSLTYLAGDDGLLLNGLPVQPAIRGSVVAGTGPANVWAYDQRMTTHYDGAAWVVDPDMTYVYDAWPLANGAIELAGFLEWRVWAATVDDVWLATINGGLVHRVPGLRDVPVSAAESRGLNPAALRGSARNDVWAVGQAGTILRFDGAQWTPVRGPMGAEDLIGLVVTPGRVFVASTAALYVLDRPTPLDCSPREERCADGVDDDCDGLIDREDPDCATGVRLAQVAGGDDRFVEVAAVAPGADLQSLDGLSLAWQQACDAAPRRYTFPAAAMLVPGQPARAVVDPHVGPREHWIDTPACPGADRSGWFALCAGPCDLTRCSNLIDYVAQGTPPAPPACARMTPGPVDLHAAGPGDSLHRVAYAGAGATGVAGDWVVLPATRN